MHTHIYTFKRPNHVHQQKLLMCGWYACEIESRH